MGVGVSLRAEHTDDPGPRPLALCLVALLSTALPFALHWGIIGVADFDQFATFNQIALWWHELGDYGVTWNPYLCGGATLVGNPQVPLFHPNLPIYRLFGPVNGLGLSFLPWMALGFWAMWRFGQTYGLRRRPAAWIATAWVVNGFFVGQLGSMHALYTAFYTLPLLFVLNRAIAHQGDLRALAAMPFALALPSLYNHHFLAYAFPFVVLHFLLEAGAGRREPHLLRKLTLYGLAVVLAVGMVGLFLVPSLAWSAEFPRFKAGEFEPPLSLIQMLLLPYPIIPFELEHDAFERYYTLGPVLFVLFVAGLRRRTFADRNLRPLVLVAGLAFVTAVGSLEPFGGPPVMPFDLLRRFVPGYPAMRVPSRFFINAIPAVLLITGLAWQHAMDEHRWSAKRIRWVLAGAVVPLLLFNFGYLNFSLFDQVRGVDRPQPAARTGDLRWAEPGYRFRMMRVLAPHVGVLDCYEALEVPRAETLRPDHGLVLRATSPADVERINWAEVLIRASAPSHVRLNFNHHRGWRIDETDGEAAIISQNRTPLEVRLSEGTFVRLRYHDPAWGFGVRVTLTALALSAVFAAACRAAGARARRRPPTTQSARRAGA